MTRRGWGRGKGALASLGLAAIFALSCGLEDTKAISAPSTFVYLSGGISLGGASASDTDFIGYRLYYRLFDKDSAASTLYREIYTLANSETQSPDVIKPILIGPKGMKEVQFTDSVSQTMLPISAADKAAAAATFTISTSVLPWTITKNGGATTLSSAVQRSAKDIGSGNYKDFTASTVLQGDEDYTGTIDNPSSVYAVFCILSVATSDGISEYYSMPTLLSGTSESYLVILGD